MTPTELEFLEVRMETAYAKADDLYQKCLSLPENERHSHKEEMLTLLEEYKSAAAIYSRAKDQIEREQVDNWAKHWEDKYND